MLEHPDITRALQTGYPDVDIEYPPHCPACGCECDYFYRDCSGAVFGCENCVERVDAGKMMKRNVEVLEAAKRLEAYKIKMLKGNPHLSADIETVLRYVRETMEEDK